MGKPAIVVISSHVVRGTVGNRAAAFALEVLGFPVWTVPTIILPWHPGHTSAAGPGERIVADDKQFAVMLGQLAKSPWIGEVKGILSGYLGSATQVSAIADLVAVVKEQNPGAIYTLDPVIGDHGNLYVPEGQAEAIRSKLLKLADMATPNPFELQWLAQSEEGDSNEALLDLARGLGPETVVVTSAQGMKRNHIGNLMLDSGLAMLAEHQRFDDVPNGLGDLTAALLLAHRLDGKPAGEMLQNATASVYEVMRTAINADAEELTLERNLGSLLKPTSQVAMRTLGGKITPSSLQSQAV